MERHKIVVLGSANTDLVIRLEQMPRPGETVLGGRFFQAAGGKGANQAVAAARAGGDVAFVACLGDDAFGAAALAGYAADGIDTSAIARLPEQATGVALILVDRHAENAIAVASGANAALTADYVRRHAALLQGAGAVVAQLETPLEAVEAAAALTAEAGGRFVLNPAPARPLPEALLAQVSVLTPNETEAEMLTGVDAAAADRPRQAARLLRDRGVGAVVLTLGRRGAFVSGDGVETLIPAYAVEAIDTTAAGDVFNGALAVALAAGERLAEAARARPGPGDIRARSPRRHGGTRFTPSCAANRLGKTPRCNPSQENAYENESLRACPAFAARCDGGGAADPSADARAAQG